MLQALASLNEEPRHCWRGSVHQVGFVLSSRIALICSACFVVCLGKPVAPDVASTHSGVIEHRGWVEAADGVAGPADRDADPLPTDLGDLGWLGIADGPGIEWHAPQRLTDAEAAGGWRHWGVSSCSRLLRRTCAWRGASVLQGVSAEPALLPAFHSPGGMRRRTLWSTRSVVHSAKASATGL